MQHPFQVQMFCSACRDKRLTTSPKHPDQPQDPPSLLFKEYQGLFPGGKGTGARGRPLTSIKHQA